ncbi:MAG: hypothetical protein KDD48_09275, partial [Bdellovibrionales bacterium]|nr:hypothetical protein [Bdellovibrionales bacterium]
INYRTFGQISDNRQFWGYEDFSVAGETLLLVSSGYTFPLKRSIDKRIGPFFLDSFYASIFYEAGNIWNHGEFKNLQNNSILLHDIGAEIRMKAFIFSDYNQWNGIVRAAHGFQDNTDHGFSNDDWPVRFYIGLGTSF